MGGLQSMLPFLDGQRLYFMGLGSILRAVLCGHHHHIKLLASHLAILIWRQSPGIGSWRIILVLQKMGSLDRDSTLKPISPLPSACVQMGRGGKVIDTKMAPSGTGLMPVHLGMAEATLTGEGTVSSERETSKGFALWLTCLLNEQ